MTQAIIESIELPPLKDDYAYHPVIIPGHPIYEQLKRQNPKALRKLLAEQRLAIQVTNTPEAIIRAREIHIQAQNEMRHEYATRGPYYYWYQEHVRGKVKVTPADRDILGLANTADTLTKHEVKNAYRRAARKLHPDVGGDAEDFKQLYAAYRTVLAVARADG